MKKPVQAIKVPSRKPDLKLANFLSSGNGRHVPKARSIAMSIKRSVRHHQARVFTEKALKNIGLVSNKGGTRAKIFCLMETRSDKILGQDPINANIEGAIHQLIKQEKGKVAADGFFRLLRQNEKARNQQFPF